MGKSFELLGMMAFQTFLAIIIGVALLASAKEEVIGNLTPENVEQFVHEMAEVMDGTDPDHKDGFNITEYLMTHVAQDGTFKNNTTYAYEDYDPQEEEMVMDKMNYIANIIKSTGKIVAHEKSVRVEHVEISETGKEATVLISSYEQGRMPLPYYEGTDTTIPMSGTSFCEHKLNLTEENIIQLTEAECSTDINFIEEIQY
jgi:hypothetical protein